MNQVEVLEILNDEDISKKFNVINTIHCYTKLYLLTAEEISEDGMTFLQPLKEHRDAYDHMIRIFGLSNREMEKSEAEKYIADNIKKTLGHEYRAFFDTADWFTYICRKKIRETLSYRGKKKRYMEAYDDFEEVKNYINELPELVVKYRREKDIANDNILGEVEEYVQTMEKLLQLYKRVNML